MNVAYRDLDVDSFQPTLPIPAEDILECDAEEPIADTRFFEQVDVNGEEEQPSTGNVFEVLANPSGIIKTLRNENESKVFKASHCSKYCILPSLITQILCDNDEDYAMRIYILKKLGRCDCFENVTINNLALCGTRTVS